jgi:hypothetical protein
MAQFHEIQGREVIETNRTRRGKGIDRFPDNQTRRTGDTAERLESEAYARKVRYSRNSS